MTNPFSIYIHIPFCEQKCSYCAFYSFKANEQLKRDYTNRIKKELTLRGGQTTRPVSSVYFGGGTPSALGADMLCEIIGTVFESFNILPDAEITLEANPADDLFDTLHKCRAAGFNRLSLGVQSANENELKTLCRRHSGADVSATFKNARKAGFENISLDLMLGLPNSNLETLKNSLDYISTLSPEHISAYILKLEEGTPLFEADICLPDDDAVAQQYLFMCEYLSSNGFEHYEISNFAKKGFHSRHNCSYWLLSEYLGFGPAAHSYFEGERFYYERDIKAYIECHTPVFDGYGGSEQEYLMLKLRLREGISDEEYLERFGRHLSKNIFKNAERLMENGLCITDNNRVYLTDEGMLVSNSIITLFSEEL